MIAVLSSLSIRETVRFLASCTGSPAEKGASVSHINYIPRSKWPKGIPPVMGAHLMPSGEVAPVSTSKGE